MNCVIKQRKLTRSEKNPLAIPKRPANPKLENSALITKKHIRRIQLQHKAFIRIGSQWNVKPIIPNIVGVHTWAKISGAKLVTTRQSSFKHGSISSQPGLDQNKDGPTHSTPLASSVFLHQESNILL